MYSRQIVFTAMHTMQSGNSHEISVRLSVSQTHESNQIKSNQIYLSVAGNEL